jgi:hypothetical protein
MMSNRRSITWKRSQDGYCDLEDGRWRIVPLHCGRVKPQWFEPRRDGKVVSGWHNTQREAKDEADRLSSLVQADEAGGVGDYDE